MYEDRKKNFGTRQKIMKCFYNIKEPLFWMIPKVSEVVTGVRSMIGYICTIHQWLCGMCLGSLILLMYGRHLLRAITTHLIHGDMVLLQQCEQTLQMLLYIT